MDITEFINKDVSIRSRDYPHFELIEGTLTESENFQYTVISYNREFSFDSIAIKEVVGNTLFI